MEISEIGDLTIWPIVAGFKEITSRDEYKYNVYEFELTSILSTSADGQETGLIPVPTRITLWQSPYDASAIPIFIPLEVGNVTIGKVMKIDAKLYTGNFTYEGTTRTPYFVTFPINDTMNCQIYDPNTYEDSFRELLSGFDVIPKKDLPAKLPLLWGE